MANPMISTPVLPPSFVRRKQHIISLLSAPPSSYTDLSPKGSIDAPIASLIDALNAIPGLVTTSSCSGRVCVYLEGERKVKEDHSLASGTLGDDEDDSLSTGAPSERTSVAPPDGFKAPTSAPATSGGKGGGGTWLFISHELVRVPLAGCALGGEPLTVLFGLARKEAHAREAEKDNSTTTTAPKGADRFARLKFESMILHILTANPQVAQRLLTAAIQAGFRESGAVGLLPHGESLTDGTGPAAAQPMVAIRSTGLSMDCIIGVVDGNSQGEIEALVDERYLERVLRVANERMKENGRRIERFARLIEEVFGEKKGGEWEDTDEWKRRKREEGLKRSKEMNNAAATSNENQPDDDINLDTLNIFN